MPEQKANSLYLDLAQESPWVMGVLNITPDSISDGGRFICSDKAIEQAQKLRTEGACIIDIGGESTAPGRTFVPAEEEVLRISPVVKHLCKEGFFISIDTYKSVTARRCLELGARMINDVSALRADREMAAVLRDFDCYIVLMFSKETPSHPHATDAKPEYKNLIKHIGDFLEGQLDYALSQGISPKRIILDPGMGRFISSDHSRSWEVIEKLTQLTERFADYPFLIAPSRKGFLLTIPGLVDSVSQLVALFAIERGAQIIRTHNAAMAKAFLRTAEQCRKAPWTNKNPT